MFRKSKCDCRCLHFWHDYLCWEPSMLWARDQLVLCNWSYRLMSIAREYKKHEKNFNSPSTKETPSDILYLSLSNILIWTSTCESARYKRNIQNRKIQSKRVLGLMKYTHQLSNHNKVTQYFFFVEMCSLFEIFSRHNQKTDTTAQLYCTQSTYVTPKTISRQNQKTNTTPQLYCALST